MRIHAFVVMLLLVPAFPHAANACGKLQPTLRAYYIQEYGEDYQKGIVSVPSPEEGATCEKIRYDLRYWHCQWGSVKLSRSRVALLKNQTQTTTLGVPLYVQQARSRKASQVGGEAAKRRSIERAWANHRRWMKQLAESKAGTATAKAGYLAAHSRFKASGCKVGIFGSFGNDPILEGSQ